MIAGRTLGRGVGLLMLRIAAGASRIPKFSHGIQSKGNQIFVVDHQSADKYLPDYKLKDFKDKKGVKISQVIEQKGEKKQITKSYFSEQSWKKIREISSNTSVRFSEGMQANKNILGIASEVLMKGYKFSRKEKDEKQINIAFQGLKQKEYILELVQSKMRAAEWANSRANEATTSFMLERAEEIGSKYSQKLKMTVIKGKQLLEDGFRLMHAVGRASIYQPAMVSFQYKGDPSSNEFISLVGKGVCFDTGGLNLKPGPSMAGMHNDKHGACSVLSAIEGVARLNLKVNVVATIGLVQNSVGDNSYRPLDIFKSRKGLTVEIGNTDAEGRLVLADCMNWVQEKYKVSTLIDMATLTGACRIALGADRAGLFSNSDQLAGQILRVGEEMEEKTWRLPVEDYHYELIKSKQADITNASRKPDASASQAAAFLKCFVEEGVNWAHLDIAGTGERDSFSTGFGAKLFLHFLRERQQKV